MRQPRWIAERWLDGKRMGWCGHLHRYPDTAARCARLGFPRGPGWGSWAVRELLAWENPWAYSQPPLDETSA